MSVRKGNSLGGGNTILQNVAQRTEPAQHALDVALSQAVVAKCRKEARGKFFEGNVECGRVSALVARWAADCARDLSMSPWSTLSTGRRDRLKACLRPEHYEAVMRRAKVQAGIGGDMPECLRPENLPKRPPIRPKPADDIDDPEDS